MKKTYNNFLGIFLLLSLYSYAQDEPRAPRESDLPAANELGESDEQEISHLGTVEIEHLCADELQVCEDANFYDSVTIKDDLIVKCDVIVSGNEEIEGNLNVHNCITTSWLEVTDNALVRNDLAVSGNEVIAGSLTASAAEILCDLDVGCNINMEDTNSAGTIGVITKNATAFIHNYGLENIFIGKNSGNFNLTGYYNVGVGSSALDSLSSGFGNVAMGRHAASNITSGSNNVVVGNLAFTTNTSGIGNAALGAGALDISTGNYNIALGFGAGDLLTTGDYNIYIGSEGVSSESNVIRIGNAQFANSQVECYIAGIHGVTTSVNDAIAVLIDSNGQLGTISSSKRFKENIKSMDPAEVMALLARLNPVEFNYISDETKTRTRGLIAEEVAEIEDGLVVYKDGQAFTVKYHELPALLIAAIQHVMKNADNQQYQIDTLEEENSVLENRIAKLEMLVEVLQKNM